MTPSPTPTDAFAPPSDWIVRWTPLLPPAAQVLDVACGHGRHAHWLAAAGHRVTAIDRDASLLAPLAGFATTLVADLEADPWPLPGRRFDAVIVNKYLWRALFPALKAAVAPGGLLIYETFAQAHAALGRPRRPEFLLRPGELIEVLRDGETRDATGPPPSGKWHVKHGVEGVVSRIREAIAYDRLAPERLFGAKVGRGASRKRRIEAAMQHSSRLA